MYLTLVHSHHWKRVPFFSNIKIDSPIIQSAVNCIFREHKHTSLSRDSCIKTTQRILLYSGLPAPQTMVIKKQKIQSKRKNSILVLTRQLQLAAMLPNHQLLCLVSSNYQKYNSLIEPTLSSQHQATTTKNSEPFS